MKKNCPKCERDGRKSLKSIFEFPKKKAGGRTTPCLSCRASNYKNKKVKTFARIMDTDKSPQDIYSETAKVKRTVNAKVFEKDNKYILNKLKGF